MVDRVRYSPDRAGTNELMNSPEMVELMRVRAEAGKAFAVTISPRETGRYADSFEVEAHPHGGPAGDRAEAILANTAPYAADVEWRNHGGQNILGRAVDVIEAG